MKKYKVIWFDDKFDNLEMIYENAFINGVELVGFKHADKGIEELNKNISEYDAAIVDGIFFRESSHSGDAVTDKAMLDVAMAIERLKSIKVLPWFILSGQTSFKIGENAYADALKENKVYDKVNETNDYTELWNDLKAAADIQIETQIRHKYKRVFDLCKNNYIGETTSVKLLSLLKQIELNQEIDSINSFNELRGILELVFGILNKIKLIPDKLFKNHGWINQTSIFLSGKHSVYKWHDEKNPIHPTISNAIYQFLKITQDGSHEFSDHLQLKIKDFVSFNKTDYLYKSTLFQLLDILVYFKQFIDDNSNETENIKLWYEEIEIPGDRIKAIILTGNNGWGNLLLKDNTTKIGIPKQMMESNNLKVGDEIEFTPKFDESKGRYHIENIKKV